MCRSPVPQIVHIPYIFTSILKSFFSVDKFQRWQYFLSHPSNIELHWSLHLQTSEPISFELCRKAD